MPGYLATKIGNTGAIEPFGIEVGRFQHLVEGRVICNTAAFLSEVSYRCYAWRPMAGRTIPNFKVTLGYTRKTATTMSLVFATNRAGTQTVLFKGAYNRDDANFSTTLGSLEADSEGTKYRDYVIKWVQEVSRTIDYLETRQEFNTDKIGFYGLSWGSAHAPVVLAVEKRIDAAVINVGGIIDELHFLPEVDAINFVRHVDTPVLMLNGEYDIVYPLETSQKPLFDLLGTDPKDKRHYVIPTSHFLPRDVVIRESLAWFDRYLGRPDY